MNINKQINEKINSNKNKEGDKIELIIEKDHNNNDRNNGPKKGIIRKLVQY